MTIDELKFALYAKVLSVLDCFDESNVPQETYLLLVQRDPFRIDEFINELIFECIFRCRNMNSPKTSIQKHVEKSGKYTDDIKSQKTRTMNKVRKYRAERAEQLEKRYNLSPSELKLPDMTPKNRRSGYHFTSEQYKQIQNMEQLTILNKIVTRQICDAKHYLRKDLIADIEAYEKHFSEAFSHCNSPEDYIDVSVELFNIESHYHIEFFYALSCVLAEQEYSVDALRQAIYLLCKAPLNPEIKTDSRFVISRLNLIPFLFSEIWNTIAMKVELYSAIKVWLFHSTYFGDENEPLSLWFSKNIDIDEQAAFIKESYNLQEIIQNKVFAPKRLQCFRQIYDYVTSKAHKD